MVMINARGDLGIVLIDTACRIMRSSPNPDI
jgi:hypothetical protein